MLVGITFVRIVHMSRFITVMLVTVTLVIVVGMLLGMVLVVVTFVRIVHMSRFITVMLVVVTLVRIVCVH